MLARRGRRLQEPRSEYFAFWPRVRADFLLTKIAALRVTLRGHNFSSDPLKTRNAAKPRRMRALNLAEPTGLEPASSGVTGRRSNRFRFGHATVWCEPPISQAVCSALFGIGGHPHRPPPKPQKRRPRGRRFRIRAGKARYCAGAAGAAFGSSTMMPMFFAPLVRARSRKRMVDS